MMMRNDRRILPCFGDVRKVPMADVEAPPRRQVFGEDTAVGQAYVASGTPQKSASGWGQW
jgi:hypothetical protein